MLKRSLVSKKLHFTPVIVNFDFNHKISPMKISIQKLSDSDFNKMGIANWPIWQKEVSSFDWHYDEQEQFFVIEGSVKIKSGKFEYNIKPGDFVICPKGLSCHWDVFIPIKKHYKFSD